MIMMNAKDTLKENNQPMSLNGWREVSKQLILAHYILINIIFTYSINVNIVCYPYHITTFLWVFFCET